MTKVLLCTFGSGLAIGIVLTMATYSLTTKAHCPRVTHYGNAFLVRAADEQARLPKGSALETMLEDYMTMRDDARICTK